MTPRPLHTTESQWRIMFSPLGGMSFLDYYLLSFNKLFQLQSCYVHYKINYYYCCINMVNIIFQRKIDTLAPKTT